MKFNMIWWVNYKLQPSCHSKVPHWKSQNVTISTYRLLKNFVNVIFYLDLLSKSLVQECTSVAEYGFTIIYFQVIYNFIIFSKSIVCLTSYILYVFSLRLLPHSQELVSLIRNRCLIEVNPKTGFAPCSRPFRE